MPEKSSRFLGSTSDQLDMSSMNFKMHINLNIIFFKIFII